MEKLKLKRKIFRRPIGKLVLVMITGLLVIVIMGCSDDDQSMEPWEAEVQQLKSAMKPFKDFIAAQNAGYDVDATGYRTQMGHHYLKASILDKQFDLENPEVLLYVPDEDGVMQLVAVEYGIAMDDFDNPPPAPEGFTGANDVWELNSEFQLWTLHVWIELENPEGIFTAMNPVLP